MLGMLEKDFFPSARKDVGKDGKGVRKHIRWCWKRGKKIVKLFLGDIKHQEAQ